MGSEDLYPHYDFNFPKIREHWKQKLGSSEEAEEYLRVVDKRLGYWLQECGTWIDFEFALKHVREDLDLRDAESHLTWLALRRRVRLANEQRKRLSPSHPRQDVAELGIPIKISQDGAHDAVWHEDFRNIYLKALARERKELKKVEGDGLCSCPQGLCAQGGLKNQPVRAGCPPPDSVDLGESAAGVLV